MPGQPIVYETLRRLGVAYEEVEHEAAFTVPDMERLAKHLGVSKGSVTPLAVLNDAGRAVEVLFDPDLRSAGRVGVHPNDNTATLLMRFDDLLRVVREHGNTVGFLQPELTRQ